MISMCVYHKQRIPTQMGPNLEKDIHEFHNEYIVLNT